MAVGNGDMVALGVVHGGGQKRMVVGRKRLWPVDDAKSNVGKYRCLIWVWLGTIVFTEATVSSMKGCIVQLLDHSPVMHMMCC